MPTTLALALLIDTRYVREFDVACRLEDARFTVSCLEYETENIIIDNSAIDVKYYTVNEYLEEISNHLYLPDIGYDTNESDMICLINIKLSTKGIKFSDNSEGGNYKCNKVTSAQVSEYIFYGGSDEVFESSSYKDSNSTPLVSLCGEVFLSNMPSRVKCDRDNYLDMIKEYVRNLTIINCDPELSYESKKVIDSLSNIETVSIFADSDAKPVLESLKGVLGDKSFPALKTLNVRRGSDIRLFTEIFGIKELDTVFCDFKNHGSIIADELRVRSVEVEELSQISLASLDSCKINNIPEGALLPDICDNVTVRKKKELYRSKSGDKVATVDEVMDMREIRTRRTTTIKINKVSGCSYKCSKYTLSYSVAIELSTIFATRVKGPMRALRE